MFCFANFVLFRAVRSFVIACVIWLTGVFLYEAQVRYYDGFGHLKSLAEVWNERSLEDYSTSFKTTLHGTLLFLRDWF